jgi:hypothetical protein
MDEFGQNSEVFGALIGDVVESRRHANRARLQRELERVLDGVNRRSGRALAAPLSLTAGDEVQGLFREPAAVVDAVVEIADAVFPARLLYGLGFGALETDLGPDPALLDGPCFHRARAALGEARGLGAWLVTHGLGDREDLVVTALFRLLGELRSRWTSIQAVHVAQARRHSQKEVAERLGKAESTISESLKAAGFQTVLAGEEALRAVLGEFGTKAEPGQHSASRSKREA